MLERQPISAKPVVADIAQPVLCTGHVRNRHSLFTKVRDLLRYRERRFVEGPGHDAGLAAMPPNKKGPPSVHTPKGRGLAGSIAFRGSGENPTKQ